jgi:hypothetical protein
MTNRLNSKAVLVTFPEKYSLEKAYDIVKGWKPDRVDYDLIDGKPVIFASKDSNFTASVARLTRAGVEFQTGDFSVPTLTNPRLRVLKTRTLNAVLTEEEPQRIVEDESSGFDPTPSDTARRVAFEEFSAKLGAVPIMATVQGDLPLFHDAEFGLCSPRSSSSSPPSPKECVKPDFGPDAIQDSLTGLHGTSLIRGPTNVIDDLVEMMHEQARETRQEMECQKRYYDEIIGNLTERILKLEGLFMDVEYRICDMEHNVEWRINRPPWE